MAHTLMGRFAIAILGLLLTAGCGAQPTLPVAPKVPARPSPPVATPDTSGAPDAQASQLLREMVAGVAAMKTATYTGTLYCRGSRGTKPKALKTLANGEWEATSVNKIAFKRPGAFRSETTSCTNPNSIGLKLVVHGSQASIRLPGVLGLMKLSLPLSDAQMLNFRGHRLDVGTPDGIAQRVGTATDARRVGEYTLNGRVLDIVEVPHAPSFDAAVTKEVVGIDRQTKLPLLNAMFVGDRRVYEMKLSNLALNGSVPSDFDEL